MLVTPSALPDGNYITTIHNLAAFYNNTKQYKKARKYYLQAYEKSGQVIAAGHDNFRLKRRRVSIHGYLAAIAMATGQAQKALDLFKTGVLEAQKLFRSHPKNHHAQRSISSAYYRLSRHYLELKDVDKALETMNKALINHQSLAKKHPHYQKEIPTILEAIETMNKALQKR